MEMKDEKIYLRVVAKDGRRFVCDQAGREVAGVREFSLRLGYNEANTISLTAFEYRSDKSDKQVIAKDAECDPCQK